MSTHWSIVSVVMLLVACAHASGGPATQCGWPALLTGGLYQPVTVRIAQHLLSQALQRDIPATGVWDDVTIDATLAFRKELGISALPILDSIVWPRLVEQTTPVVQGSHNAAVYAVQEGLVANGFNVTIDGNYSAVTAFMVDLFRLSRNDTVDVNNATTLLDVVASTMHLLITECRAPGGVFWFDAGWPQGKMSASLLQCLRESGFQFATFECWVEEGVQGMFWGECVGNIQRAWEAGYQAVGAYMFAQRFYDPEPQARWLLGNLSEHGVNVSAIMLDVEGDKWNKYTQEENRAFITALRRVLQDEGGMNVTVYCGREWSEYFGRNFTTFSDLPLFYAHYDNVPSFYDFGPYGGWSRPAGKQFWDGTGGERVCGSGELDWDWSPAPFWT